MKLAYVTIFDPSDIHAWSGTGVYVLKALQSAGIQTENIGSLRYKYDFIYKVKEVLYSRLINKKYKALWDPILLRQFAYQVDWRLTFIDVDVVFSIWSNPIAYLQTEKPIVFCGDATLAGLMDFYPWYRNICAETVRGGKKAEQLALTKCRLAIYSSEWAANTAIHNYIVDPAKVKVVPFGANISCRRNINDIHTILNNKNFDVCKLLFIGVEWDREGGDTALEVAKRLNQRGIRTELHVVGCNPPGKMPDFVKLHGFVSKTTESGTLLLNQLFSQSHFFILLSKAEAYGVVFAEASSFGLPSLATDVGGIPTVIQEGKNGYTFSISEGPDAYCNTIHRLWSSKPEYKQLVLSSFREYRERLNWETAGRKVKDLLQEACIKQY